MFARLASSSIGGPGKQPKLAAEQAVRAAGAIGAAAAPHSLSMCTTLFWWRKFKACRKREQRGAGVDVKQHLGSA